MICRNCQHCNPISVTYGKCKNPKVKNDDIFLGMSACRHFDERNLKCTKESMYQKDQRLRIFKTILDYTKRARARREK